MEKESLGKRILNILKKPFAILAETFREIESPEELPLTEEEKAEIIAIQKMQMKVNGYQQRDSIVEKVIPNDIYKDYDKTSKAGKKSKKQEPILEGPGLD